MLAEYFYFPIYWFFTEITFSSIFYLLQFLSVELTVLELTQTVYFFYKGRE